MSVRSCMRKRFPCQSEEHFQQCHTVFGNLHSFVHASLQWLNYCTASMRCSVSHTRNAEVSRACDHHTFKQPTLDLNCDQPNSTTTNVVYYTAYSSASAPSWTRNFYLPHPAFGAAVWKWFHRNYVEIFWTIKSESPGYRAALFLRSMCLAVGTTPACDRQTDRSDRHAMAANTARAGKNLQASALFQVTSR